ncbi:MAG: hypothetical protein KGJ44_12130 [Betaproteobacteria bacterium]|nr:hypothetical protein [Betaproteobacteria bacterium]
MNFGLLIVGDEILSGRRQDKHLSKVIELLNARGLTLEYCEYVGDDPVRITASLRRAFASGDAVFSTGGIGATPDDHTRQCAAAALGVPLALHPEAKALILQRMQDIAREQGVPYEPDREDNVHRLNMGVFPQGAQIIPNPYNKIPGFSCWAPAGGSEAAERGGVPRSGAGPSQAASTPSGGSEATERGGMLRSGAGPSQAASTPSGGSEAAERGGMAASGAGPSQAASAPSGGSEASERGGMLRSGAGPSQAASAPSGGSEASERGGIHFVPGFPVMAWPMIEWVLDTYYAPCFHRSARVERSVIVYGAMEATLTPLMEQIEARFAPVKVFSLPSVDHPEHGRHIDLGVKGTADLSLAAFGALKDGLAQLGARLGPEMVR